MFDNVGKKIKSLAIVLFAVGVFASLILGFMIPEDGDDFEEIVVGLMTMAVGCLFSWVGSLFTYGFGQLIEDNMLVRQKLMGPSVQPAAEPEKTREQQIHENMRSAASILAQAVASEESPVQPELPTPPVWATEEPAPEEERTENPGWICTHCQFFNTTNGERCIRCGKSKDKPNYAPPAVRSVRKEIDG